MKTEEWINDNRMRFDSGFKEFDRQTRIISTGNLVAGTQISSYIRAYNDVKTSVGTTVPKGELQDFDLNGFRNLPYYVREYIKKMGRFIPDQKFILYEFYHHLGKKGSKRTITDGWVLTDKEYKLITYWITGPTWKSRLAVEEAIKYITE